MSIRISVVNFFKIMIFINLQILASSIDTQDEYDTPASVVESDISEADNAINSGQESLKSIENIPMVNNFGPEKDPDLLNPASFPKEVVDFMENLNKQNINEVYEELKKLPEGEVSSEVQNFLSNPNLQNPEKLTEALKSMKIGPLTSLVYSISKANTHRIAEETWSKDHTPNEALNILTTIANGKLDIASKDRTEYEQTMKKLTSPEGVAELFGGGILNGEKNLSAEHVKAISYELKQNGYSDEDTAKILTHITDTLNQAMLHASASRFDMAAEKLLEYQETLKQYQVSQIYTLNTLDQGAVEKLALSMQKSHLTEHGIVTQNAQLIEGSGLKNHLLSGNALESKHAAQQVLLANTSQIKSVILSQLAASMHIKDNASLNKLSASIESNADYKSLLLVMQKSFLDKMSIAAMHARNGNYTLFEETIKTATMELSSLQHPDVYGHIQQSIYQDFFTSTPAAKLEPEPKQEEAPKQFSLSDLNFTPPVVLHDITSTVEEARKDSRPPRRSAYEHHEQFNTAAMKSAKHNIKGIMPAIRIVDALSAAPSA